MSEPRAAAVFVPIRRDGTGTTEIGFAVRSPDSTTHAGHVGFPGGTVEPADSSLQETAERETVEETALAPADFAIRARIDDHHTRSTGFAVAPFVGSVDAPERFVPDSRELTDTFWVSETRLRAAYKMDDDRVRFRVDPEVWGVTARVVVSLLVPGLDSRLD